MAIAPGSKLGPYEIQSLLGAGAMGEVYRARDPRLGRSVAIKVLPTSFASDAERLSRFELEARTVAALSHPNIVAVFDGGDFNGTPYLVSELLDGETLRDRLSQGLLAHRRVLEFACQIANGLAAAHNKGIVHRDLKPENIYITRDGQVKILDFGLAKLMPARSAAAASERATEIRTIDTSPGMVLGTTMYMSPEQVRSEEVDARSDLFSLGAVLYEMLSGEFAFRRQSSVETMNAILKEEPRDLRAELRVPPAVERIVRRCLEKDPEHRFQSAKDLAFALEALSGSSSVVPKASQPKNRMPLVLASIAIVTVAFAAWKLLPKFLTPPPATYQQITFRRGSVHAARFAPDGVGIIYSAQWEGGATQVQTSRMGDIEFRSAGLPPATLAAVSSQGDIAVLLGCEPFFVMECGGTLAKVPAGGSAPRQLLDHVHYADWSPDGTDLAVVTQDPNGRNRLEYPIGHVLYETSGWISAPRVSPDGKLVAFANHPLPNDDRGDVAIVGADAKPRTLVQNLASIEGIVWQSGQKILFAASGPLPSKSAWSDSLFLTDLDGRWRTLVHLPGILRLHDISRDGRLLISRETWRHQITGFFPGDHSEHPYSWLDWSIASGSALSNDGHLLLFTEAGAAASDNYAPYLRPTDSSPAARLTTGAAIALSPDGKWAAVDDLNTNTLNLVPTGPGKAHTLDRGPIQQYDFPGWWPRTGKIIAFAAQEPGRGLSVYLQSIDGGLPHRVTPEMQHIGMLRPHFAVSDDAKLVAAIPAGASKIHLYDDAGHDLGVMPGSNDGEAPAAFAQDGRLLVGPVQGSWPLLFSLIDPKSGKRTLWKQLAPLDPTGMRPDWDLAVTPDLRFYAYAMTQATSELYVMDSPH